MHPEVILTLDEAIRDLLDVSTDITAVAVVDESGAVVGAGPGAADERAPQALNRLWDAASRRIGGAGDAGLEHLVVPLADGVVAAVEAYGHRAVAVTGSGPAVALLLFDLRTCLRDALAGEEEAG